MKKAKTQVILASICSIAIVAFPGCARHGAVAEKTDAPAMQDTPAITAEDESDMHTPSRAERITLLREKLASLEDDNDPDLESSPHRERRQDPAAIHEAIQQLQQGAEICTRCLMECGAP
jgi:hypothetical protein